jgi:hypothetical protein
MSGLASKSLAVLLVFALTATAADAPSAPANRDKVSLRYDAYQKRGFRILFNKQLVDGGQSLHCLDDRLEEIERLMPAVHLSILREVTIWIESTVDSRLPPTLTANAGACYMPLGDQYDPRAYGLPAETKGGVVLFADTYLGKIGEKKAASIAPGWLVHEMSHALHDRMLGTDNPSLKTTFQQAIDRRLYDSVATRYWMDLGQVRIERGPAYARTNHIEYFAELSAAYLNIGNWSYPYMRDDLADHDPGGYLLMDRFWRPVKYRVVNESTFPVSLERRAESGRRFRLFDLMPGKEKAFEGWEGMSLAATDLLDGTEYPVNMPAKNGSTWRLTPNATSH